MRLVYIAGPVSGITDYNRPAFMAAEKALSDQGIRSINPARIGDQVFARFRSTGKEPNWHDFMRADLPALCKCDTILMLPGWEYSRGAKWERIIAKHVLNMKVIEKMEEIVPAP